MKKPFRPPLIVTALLLGALAVFFYATYRQQHPPMRDMMPANAEQATQRLLALSLPNPKGVTQPLSQWHGKILVVNFWATWCPPCRQEIPGFSRLQTRFADKGVQFVGIAFDSPEKVAEFAQQYSPAYPFLIASHAHLSVAVGLGDVTGSLPFTAIIGRDGRLLQARSGFWPEGALNATLAELTQ